MKSSARNVKKFSVKSLNQSNKWKLTTKSHCWPNCVHGKICEEVIINHKMFLAQLQNNYVQTLCKEVQYSLNQHANHFYLNKYPKRLIYLHIPPVTSNKWTCILHCTSKRAAAQITCTKSFLPHCMIYSSISKTVDRTHLWGISEAIARVD